MDAVTRRTLWSSDEQEQVMQAYTRAIRDLQGQRAAFEAAFIYGTTAGERFASIDLNLASMDASEIHDDLQIELHKHIRGHLYDNPNHNIEDIRNGNVLLQEMQDGWKEILKPEEAAA